jgi:membrane glycosyltransferase
VLLGSFGYAFKIKTLNAQVWQVTIVIYPLLVVLETVFDFYTGGYVINEMITHSLLVILLTSILLAPVIMYLDDFNVVKDNN